MADFDPDPLGIGAPGLYVDEEVDVRDDEDDADEENED